MDYGFYDSLILAKGKYGDKPVIKDIESEITYSGLLSMIDSIECELKKRGVKSGERIGILSFNTPEWLAFFFAIVKCRCVAVCLNYSFTDAELNDYIKLTDCSFLLYGECQGMTKDSSFISHISLDEEKKACFDEFSFEEHSNFEYQNISEEEFESPAYIIFTSGTSGTPKGSMLTQKSSLYGTKGFLDAISEIEEESICVGVPLFHVFGLSMCIAHIMNGGTLFLPRIFSSTTMVSYINRFKIDSIMGVMTVIIRMLDDKDFSPNGYSSIRRVYTGGAPLLPVQCHRVERGFGDALLLNCYGQSETDAGITITTPRCTAEQRVNTVGKPCSQRLVCIMNGDKICKANETGEIVLFDNGTITKGYYNVPKEAQPIDEKGYLHTGDLGYLDEDGYLHLAGRIKDIIIKGGENIVPGDIERIIVALDEVSDVKVMGAHNDLYGESIEACVVLNKGYSITGDKIKEKLMGEIPSFKMPSHFFVFDNFPLKPNGKLDVCELSLNMLDRLNAAMIETDIQKGINVLSVEFRKQKYMIAAITSITESLISQIGFAEKIRKNHVVLCVEEMLLEIANEAYRESGVVKVIYTLFENYLRISFLTENDRLIFDDEHLSDRSVGVAIIINYVDAINYKEIENGVVKYDIDFLLPEFCHSEEYFM